MRRAESRICRWQENSTSRTDGAQLGLRSSAAVVVASHYMRAEVVRNGVSATSVSVVPYFPTSQTRDPHPPEARPKTDRLLFVGRVTEAKGLDILVEALPVVERVLKRRLTLVVAGDGSELRRVVRRSERLGLRLEAHSWVSAPQREVLMRRADLLVMPSVWPEPFGLVGIEAASIGLPAVAFASGGTRDWLLSGESGEVSEGAPSSLGLSAAIVRALGSAEHHQRLREGAWARSGRFSAAAHLAALRQILPSETPRT